jgi:hypothetical protein
LREKNLRAMKFEKKIKWSKKIVIKRMSIKFERLKNHRGEIKNHL